jgi:heme exporter protein C
MRLPFTVLAVVALLLLSWGLHVALEVVPTEQTMGNIQRIFYYHFPSFIIAFLFFFINFLVSVAYLAGRKQPGGAMGADAGAVSAAEIGLLFCTAGLVQGPLWARPVWGIWWTWDARLTTTFLLWLIYVSYLILRRYSAGGQTATLAAALAIFGFADVPIVYMSIRWWRTQHPQPVIGGGADSGLDSRMWQAVWWNLAGFMVLACLLFWWRYRLERTRQQIEEQAAMESLEEPAMKGAR